VICISLRFAAFHLLCVCVRSVALLHLFDHLWCTIFE